jgi:hypothetical protein
VEISWGRDRVGILCRGRGFEEKKDDAVELISMASDDYLVLFVSKI